MKHKHAELMAEYAKDAMETDRPWERWECCYRDMGWAQLQSPPLWDTFFTYRRKPMPKEITEQSDVDLKLRATSSAAARFVPEDQIKDVIKWTENYLETLRARTLVSPQSNTNQQQSTPTYYANVSSD